MIKTALGTLALARIAVAAPLQDCSLDPRVASEWTSAVVGILAANAHGYGPGYYYSPGYALSRGPDIAALAMVLRAPAGSFAAAGATDSTIAEARWLDDRSQSGSY